jgi:hypothetical protein
LEPPEAFDAAQLWWDGANQRIVLHLDLWQQQQQQQQQHQQQQSPPKAAAHCDSMPWQCLRLQITGVLGLGSNCDWWPGWYQITRGSL